MAENQFSYNSIRRDFDFDIFHSKLLHHRRFISNPPFNFPRSHNKRIRINPEHSNCNLGNIVFSHNHNADLILSRHKKQRSRESCFAHINHRIYWFDFANPCANFHYKNNLPLLHDPACTGNHHLHLGNNLDDN